MARLNTLFGLSSSTTMREKGEWSTDSHFRWHSIKKYLSIASTMSATVFSYDIFSKISTNVRIFDFTLLGLTVGISYLCMDSFVKQYTRRFDCNKYLNPLLRGISYGQFLQTGYFSLVHGSFIVDTIRFLVGAINEVPMWAICAAEVNITCVPMKDVILRCNKNTTTAFTNTSAFLYYANYFTYGGKRTTMTSRLFLTAIVWILTFFLSSVTEETIVKIFRITYVYRTITTITAVLLLLFAAKPEAIQAFANIVDVTAESSWTLSMQLATYTYGIGFLGIYDFGTISTYTMMDTAAVLFMISFTVLSLLRSWIVKILYLGMIKCVVIDETYIINTHKLLYAILPMTTEFLHAKKLYVLYLFGNLAITLMSLETFMVSTMSKFLQYEFQNVKRIYIVGVVCALGFGITVTFTALSTSYGKRQFAVWDRGMGVDLMALYLSGFRVAIIMWLYGVNRFSTDVHFWLGFRPTRFWTITWSMLPILLFGFMVNKGLLLLQLSQSLQYKSLIWMSFTMFIVMTFQIKTISKYLMNNNIIGLFKANRLYGPPESDDRKRRHFYNEVTRQRKCKHNCMVIDEWFDCEHVDIVIKLRSAMSTLSEEPSLMNIYKDEVQEKAGHQLRGVHISGE